MQRRPGAKLFSYNSVVSKALIRMVAAVVLAGAAAWPANAQTQIIATVVDKKTSEAVTGLTAQDFRATDDKAERKIESVDYTAEPMDSMLLVDASLMGEAVKPIANLFINQLQSKEEMALVEFASAADLVQDFTSNKTLLKRALDQVKYGGEPRLFDALYAAMNGGFQNSTYRRVIILLTAGYEGDSRVRDKEVIQMAQKGGITICPVYLVGAERLQDGRACRENRRSFISIEYPENDYK